MKEDEICNKYSLILLHTSLTLIGTILYLTMNELRKKEDSKMQTAKKRHKTAGHNTDQRGAVTRIPKNRVRQDANGRA